MSMDDMMIITQTVLLMVLLLFFIVHFIATMITINLLKRQNQLLNTTPRNRTSVPLKKETSNIVKRKPISHTDKVLYEKEISEGKR